MLVRRHLVGLILVLGTLAAVLGGSPERAAAAVGPVTVVLNPGWNGVAFQCSRLTSLSGAGGVAGMAYFDGTAYVTGSLSVTDVDAGDGPRRGFWVFAPAATTFTYSGDDDGLGNKLDLRTGWNLVSFAGPGTVPGSSLAATQGGAPVPLTSSVLNVFYQINPDNTSTPIDVIAGGSLTPGRPCWVFAAAATRLTWTPGPVPSPTPVPTPPPSAGLARLNALRSMGSMPLVGESASLSDGCMKHCLWMILNNIQAHFETPGTPGFTPEGDTAAIQSNIAALGAIRTIEQNINEIMSAPFHGVGMIDPLMRNAGFGHVTNTSLPPSVIRCTTAININGDRPFSLPAGTSYPFFWPADGKTMDIANFTGRESPNPLSGHPGVTGPTGCPLYIIRGFGETVPSVTAFSLTRGGAPEVVLEFDETNYSNPSPADQTLGRQLLNARNAIVLIPRNPLIPGASYTASVTTNGQTFTWTFSVSPSAVTIP